LMIIFQYLFMFFLHILKQGRFSVNFWFNRRYFALASTTQQAVRRECPCQVNRINVPQAGLRISLFLYATSLRFQAQSLFTWNYRKGQASNFTGATAQVSGLPVTRKRLTCNTSAISILLLSATWDKRPNNRHIIISLNRRSSILRHLRSPFQPPPAPRSAQKPQRPLYQYCPIFETVFRVTVKNSGDSPISNIRHQKSNGSLSQDRAPRSSIRRLRKTESDILFYGHLRP
jgi:hypothetical protein